MEELGTVSILNVGHGDTTLSFNSDNPDEVEKAKKIVEDMLKRGYALLIQVGTDEEDGEPIYRRAHGFDPETCEYIIASTTTEKIDIGASAPKPKSKRKAKTKRVPAAKTRSVAVSRTAGG